MEDEGELLTAQQCGVLRPTTDGRSARPPSKIGITVRKMMVKPYTSTPYILCVRGMGASEVLVSSLVLT